MFLIDDLIVYRDVGVVPPEAPSWKAYLREIRRFTPRVARCLVVPRVAGLTRVSARTFAGCSALVRRRW